VNNFGGFLFELNSSNGPISLLGDLVKFCRRSCKVEQTARLIRVSPLKDTPNKLDVVLKVKTA